MPFSSPTIWCFFFAEDYVKFLENLRWYLKQPIGFKSTSKHALANKLREKERTYYPIGVLADDIEVHFKHYNNDQEALEKWNKRVKRINFDNLFIIFSDIDLFDDSLLERYEKLPFANKIFFTSKLRVNCHSAVYVEDYSQEQSVGDSSRNRKYEKYIDLTKWLNGEKNFKRRKLFSPIIT